MSGVNAILTPPLGVCRSSTKVWVRFSDGFSPSHAQERDHRQSQDRVWVRKEDSIVNGIADLTLLSCSLTFSLERSKLRSRSVRTCRRYIGAGNGRHEHIGPGCARCRACAGRQVRTWEAGTAAATEGVAAVDALIALCSSNTSRCPSCGSPAAYQKSLSHFTVSPASLLSTTLTRTCNRCDAGKLCGRGGKGAHRQARRAIWRLRHTAADEAEVVAESVAVAVAAAAAG